MTEKKYRMSEEHKKKIALAHIGKHRSEETKRKISEKLKGRPLSEEHKKKIALAHIGKHRSEETKRKISKTKKRLYTEGAIIPWNKNKKLTIEQKRKFIEAMMKGCFNLKPNLEFNKH